MTTILYEASSNIMPLNFLEGLDHLELKIETDLETAIGEIAKLNAF